MTLPRSLFALFFLQLALGIVLCLPLLRPVGRGFARFCGALALVLLLLVAGFLLRPGEAGPAAWAGWALVGFIVALVLHQTALWRGAGPPQVAPLWLAAAAGLVAGGAYVRLLLPSGLPAWQAAYAAAGLFSTTAVLGAVMGAMLLGHWYLVRFDLPIDPFRRMTGLLLAALGLRALLSAGSLPLFVPGADELGQPLYLAFASKHMVFLLTRLGMGILAPLLFAWMAHQTVKIHSKQSATGILYVTIVPVFIGELTADFLFLATAVPV